MIQPVQIISKLCSARGFKQRREFLCRCCSSSQHFGCPSACQDRMLGCKAGGGGAGGCPQPLPIPVRDCGKRSTSPEAARREILITSDNQSRAFGSSQRDEKVIVPSQSHFLLLMVWFCHMCNRTRKQHSFLINSYVLTPYFFLRVEPFSANPFPPFP